DSFESLGGDSLHYIQFSLSFERHFGALPDDWERLSTTDLQRHVQNSDKSTWRQLETVTLTRAFFMICIIGLHADAFVYSQNWGAAYFLLILAGYSVARFQMPEIIRSGSVKTLWGTIFAVAIPTVLIDAIFELATRNFEWPSLVLVSNYQTPANITGYTFYFAEIYIQLMLVCMLLFLVPKVRAAFHSHPLPSALALFVFAIAIDMFVEANWDGDYNYHRTPWHYGWCFALGMIIASAKTMPSRIFAGVLCAVWAPYYFEPSSAALYVAGGCTLIIFVRSLAVPAKLKTVVAEIAGASMFIYLTHYPMLSVVNKAFGHAVPWVAFFASILAGIISARIYIWLERKLLQILRRRAQAHPGAVLHT
ncbi:MAG: hypothetical protein U1E06_20210, partial [Tabrizicola sp.]|nr:hypothetical protein [Tabrizicola sp.]